MTHTIKDHAFDASIKFLLSVFLFPFSMLVVSVLLWLIDIEAVWIWIYLASSFLSLYGFKEWVRMRKKKKNDLKWHQLSLSKPAVHKEMVDALERLHELKLNVSTH